MQLLGVLEKHLCELKSRPKLAQLVPVPVVPVIPLSPQFIK